MGRDGVVDLKPQETIMLTVSKAARNQVEAYFQDNEVKPVRIFLSNGCGGPQLALALDKKNETDLVYQFDDIEFAIEKSLMDQVKPIKIDFGERGFEIASSLQPSGGCGGCGSSDSCCS